MKDRKKHTGFGTPDNYFNEFEDKMFKRLSEGIMPKSTGYKAPKGYFEELDDCILERVRQSERNTKIIPLFTRKTILYAASIAACAILIFSLTNTSQAFGSIEDIDISSIESYIEEGMLGYDLNDVTALLEEEDIIELISVDEQLTDEMIEDFLLKNIDDTTLLIE